MLFNDNHLHRQNYKMKFVASLLNHQMYTNGIDRVFGEEFARVLIHRSNAEGKRDTCVIKGFYIATMAG